MRRDPAPKAVVARGRAHGELEAADDAVRKGADQQPGGVGVPVLGRDRVEGQVLLQLAQRLLVAAASAMKSHRVRQQDERASASTPSAIAACGLLAEGVGAFPSPQTARCFRRSARDLVARSERSRRHAPLKRRGKWVHSCRSGAVVASRLTLSLRSFVERSRFREDPPPALDVRAAR